MEQAISKQSMAPLCEPIYTLRAMMANSITSIFSFLVQVIAIVLFYCYSVLSKLSFLYHRRKLNYQIWDMDKRS